MKRSKIFSVCFLCRVGPGGRGRGRERSSRTIDFHRSYLEEEKGWVKIFDWVPQSQIFLFKILLKAYIFFGLLRCRPKGFTLWKPSILNLRLNFILLLISYSSIYFAFCGANFYKIQCHNFLVKVIFIEFLRNSYWFKQGVNV